MKRILLTTCVVGLGLAGLGAMAAPAQADCGGDYVGYVEADTGQGVSYCSDGTLDGVRDVTAPTEYEDEDDRRAAEESCGGEYPVGVEVESIQVQPGLGAGYCSDGTFSEAGVPATGNGTSSCGGRHDATIEGDSGQGVGYCSDGTVGGVNDLTAPPGDQASGCGDEGDPVTVEVDLDTVQDGTSWCSPLP